MNFSIPRRVRINARAALTRATRTLLQVLIPALGAGAITDLDYVGAVSIAAGAALISLLQGVLAGLPEAPQVSESSPSTTVDDIEAPLPPAENID